MIEELRQRISPEVKEGVSLGAFTTFKIGGPAEFFFEATTSEDAIKALGAAKELGVEISIFGGGSNMIVADTGVKGLVIRLRTQGFALDGTTVVVDAGLTTGAVAVKTVAADLTGMEWSVGIPGTVGGAIRGNAGSYGTEMKDVVTSVRALKDGEVIELSNEECAFSYRDSVFKRQPDILILQATLGLKVSTDPAASKKRIKDIVSMRKDTQPVECSTSGCVFMNWKPPGKEELESIRKTLDLDKDEDIPMTVMGTVPAGWIIDRAQLKGMKVGKAMVSEKHGNFIVTEKSARADDVVALIAAVKSRIRTISEGTIYLTEEVEYIGF